MGVPDNEMVIAVVSWLGGILAAVIVQQILNRRALLSYSVHHHKIGATAEDKTFGTVQVTWNGAPLPNIYLSTVELRNESTRDLQSLRIRAYTGDTILLSELPQLAGTTQSLRYSPEYEQLMTVSPGKQPSEHQQETHGKQREYLVPVFNRGQVIKLQYVNTSKSDAQPSIWLDVVHPGVHVEFRPARVVVFGVPRQLAIIAGVMLGVFVSTLLAAYSPYAWLTAFAAFFFGLVAQMPGAYAIKALRWLRHKVFG